MTTLEAYDYDLPPELIAQRPSRTRSDARLMVVHRDQQTIEHYHVRDLLDFLHPEDCLVLNDTRVIPAKLHGYRERTGGRWDGLFLSADESRNWRVLCKTRGRLVSGETIMLIDRELRDQLQLTLLTRLEHGEWAVRPESNSPYLELLQRVGRVPLPHYIRKGQMVDADWDSYQTVFAEHPGSVAAPTAGLHFTPQLLDQAQEAGLTVARVTLHVGAGTFRPIKTDEVEDHQMHCEWGCIDNDTAEQLRTCSQRGGRVIAVGTTTVRVLESASAQGTLTAWTGETDLYIHPPYAFRAIDCLLTNFHLPKSTLLVLVRTLGGDDLIRRAYEEAIAESYRFFSYGDAMLIL